MPKQSCKVVALSENVKLTELKKKMESYSRIDKMYIKNESLT